MRCGRDVFDQSALLAAEFEWPNSCGLCIHTVYKVKPRLEKLFITVLVSEFTFRNSVSIYLYIRKKKNIYYNSTIGSFYIYIYIHVLVLLLIISSSSGSSSSGNNNNK